jgi:hypothetical protein
MKDLSYLEVLKLIVHEFPKKGDITKAGVLSEVESPMVPRVRHFFETRVKVALSQGVDVRFVAGHPSPIPSLVAGLLRSHGRTAFVDDSQLAAGHFFTLMQGNQSEGLFCMLKCKLQSGAPAIGLVKLDHEKGIRAVLTTTTSGRTYTIVDVPDLMLTANTKLFKVAVFYLDEDGDIAGVACDAQIERAQVLAKYFRDDFLGCELVNKPDLATRAFLDGAESFIHGIHDPEKQTQYHTALLTELLSNHTSVTPRQFADAYLEPEHRSAFFRSLSEAGAPATRFQKDIGLVRRRITRVRFEFANNVWVVAPPDEVAEGGSVGVTHEPDGQTRIEVKGELTNTQGAK